MVQLALKIPGFGGFFLNLSSPLPDVRQAPSPFKFTAFLTDLSVAEHAAQVLTTEFAWAVNRPEDIGFIQAEYDMLELARWECQTFPVVAPYSWTTKDLNEARNRVVFGFDTEQARALAKQRLESLALEGVPLDAFIFEVHHIVAL